MVSSRNIKGLIIKGSRICLEVPLSFGQGGLVALPQLASHLCSKKQLEYQYCLNITYTSELHNPLRLPADSTQRRTFLPLPAIMLKQYSSTVQLMCLAPRYKQHVYPLSALSFAELPRGPPELT